MNSWSVFLVFLVLFSHIVLAQQYQYRALGSFSVSYAAFLNLGYFTEQQRAENYTSLLITSFSGSPIFATNDVHLVENIGAQLNNVAKISPTLITKDLVWPNEATAVPFEIFNMEAIGVGNGFLVPGKSTGYVSVIPLNSSTPHHLSQKKTDWFYHVAEWWDMNGDGLQDCVTARATVPVIGSSKGELVWFEHPNIPDPLSTTWTEHVIANGPDIMIHLIFLEEGAQPQIVAAEFLSNVLTLYWVEGDNWTTGQIKSRVIDNDLGAPFDTEFVDLNNDGKLDLLVTNHEGQADKSAVFAYTVPTNWKTDPWPRYVLATNITTLKRGENQASPGKATAFHPLTTQTNQKRYILVAGDGAEVAFMLYPNSEDPNDWTYTRKDVINTGCTVGQVVAGDVDGDTYSEFFVPAFEKGTVYVYTYAPQ